jgi:hypothetical protein
MSIEQAVQHVIKSLSARQQEIIKERFGIGGHTPQTLAAIGKRHGITRERVRQIETGALKALKEKIRSHKECGDVLARSAKFLKSQGGVAGKEQLLGYQEGFLDRANERCLELLIAASGAFHLHEEDNRYRPFYYLDKKYFQSAEHFIEQWVRFLRKHEKEAHQGKYDELLKQFIRSQKVSPLFAKNALSISKKIHANPYGDVGLAEWPFINPTTTRDRIYLVLKKQTAPLHFRIIARTISEQAFDDKEALPATVHNELIKDERFVLVGRGMYGLREHGFIPGTAREVIERILKAQGPLASNDVILAVQKERFLKPNTVLVNLQNKLYFQRLADGRYHVREA